MYSPLNIEYDCHAEVEEELEDTKRVISIRKSKEYRQYNGKKGLQDKQRSTKHAHKTKDRVTRIPLKMSGELRCSES